MMKILPFSGDQLNYYFRANSKLMAREEVLSLLPDGLVSKKFFDRQEVLPLDLQERMVTIDRSGIKANVRYIKIGKKEGGE